MSQFSRVLLLLGWIFIYSYDEVSATIAPCAENRTELCIQNLATFIALDKPRFAAEVELERLCREAEYGQRCSSDFLRTSTCVNPYDEVVIPLQIGRSQAVSQMLCSTGGYITDPAFRKVYLRHSSCIEEHQRRIKECYVSANMIEDPELEIVRNSTKTTQEKYISACCPMVQYIECSENAIGSSCGSESKNVVLRVMMKAAGKQLQEFCTNVDPSYPNNPTACVSSAVQLVPLTIIYFSFFCVIFIAYALL